MNTIKVLPLNDADTRRPLWSVMIPAYNANVYLRKTIESVLIQDRGAENMEIWVVDDFSSESPQKIVEEIGKGRVNFYRQKHNVGQLNNFSTCLNLARGQFIHLLHGDDYVHDGFYDSQENPLLTNKKIGAAFTGSNLIDENGNLINASKNLADRPGIIDDFVSVIARNQVIQTPAIVVKREVYEKLGAFNKDLNWVEDWEMWIRIACHFDFYYDPNILASYRVHSNSNTEDSITTGRFISDVLRCINIYSGYLDLPKRKKREIINAAKQHYLKFAIQQSKRRKSVSILLRSFPLVYDYSSFMQLLRKIISVAIPGKK